MRRARDLAATLFADRFGAPPTDVRRVAADGSARRYWRLTGPGGETAIGAYGPEREENAAFLSFSRTFRRLGLPVPEIYGADEGAGVWLEEDLGNATLFDLLSAARAAGGEGDAAPGAAGAGGPGRAIEAAGGGGGPGRAGGFPASIVSLYRRVLELLPRFQVEGGRAVDFRVAYPRAAFDRQSILWDLNYFKYHFLKLARVPFNEARLEKDFGRLVRFLLEADSGHFLYRDFQSRNVMVRDGEPWFIDYQGGRRGALQYDPASLLYDAKADLPDPLREELLEGYLDALEGHIPVDREAFRARYPGFVLVRLMQAMGAYGYRGFFEGKPHFLQSVPFAARTLERLLERGLPVELPELEGAFRRIVAEWAGRSPETLGEARDEGRLTVRIGSFSFRGGYPEDPAGHGGFVFDCRSVPNPGREERFREATGLDAEVAGFLEVRPETAAFWDRVRGLAEAQVREYLERGHADLSVEFGCTGGQHRSVYFAERLARHLRSAYPALTVTVVHREREAWPGGGRPRKGRSGGAGEGSGGGGAAGDVGEGSAAGREEEADAGAPR